MAIHLLIWCLHHIWLKTKSWVHLLQNETRWKFHIKSLRKLEGQDNIHMTNFMITRTFGNFEKYLCCCFDTNKPKFCYPFKSVLLSYVSHETCVHTSYYTFLCLDYRTTKTYNSFNSKGRMANGWEQRKVVELPISALLSLLITWASFSLWGLIEAMKDGNTFKREGQ